MRLCHKLQTKLVNFERKCGQIFGIKVQRITCSLKADLIPDDISISRRVVLIYDGRRAPQ